MIDATLPALNAAFSFLDVSLQEGSLHPVILTTSGQRWPAGGLCLDQRCSDRSPLRLNRDDNRNSHTPETAVELRLRGRPSLRALLGTVSVQPARERSLLPAILQMPTCGVWGFSSPGWPTGSGPIPTMSRIAPSRRSIACANADRFSVLDSSMSLLPSNWGTRSHRRFVLSQRLEHWAYSAGSSQRGPRPPAERS